MTDLTALERRVSAAKSETLARGETFYPGPSRVHLAAFPPKERWDDWVDIRPDGSGRRTMLVPTTCFNCEAACGLLAYVDRDTLQVRRFEGNPEHPGSRGRNCAKGPATLNQITDPDRILYPLRRVGPRGGGEWERVTWDEALDDLAERIRTALQATRIDPLPRPVTGSFGVAQLAAGELGEALLQRADKALYAAKQSGRNRVAAG